MIEARSSGSRCVQVLLAQGKTNEAALERMRHRVVSYRTAWRVKHKLTQALCAQEASRQLGGMV